MADKYLPRQKVLNKFSKSLRNNATTQENHLWYDFLRTHPVQFNRQRIIGGYIADFYADKLKLVIELDGGQHYEDEALDYDRKRTAYFESLGLCVVRFTNTDIDRNFEGVCLVIEQTIENQMRIK